MAEVGSRQANCPLRWHLPCARRDRTASRIQLDLYAVRSSAAPIL